MKLNQILQKHGKKIVIAMLILLALKNFQSCNRKHVVQTLETKITATSDSLNRQIEQARDSIVKLQYELKLAKFSVESAEKRAEAVQSTAEKTVRNTTIQIK